MVDHMWCSLTFERCSHQELCRCAVASKQWQPLALDPDVWRVLAQQHFDKYYVPESIKMKLSHDACHPMSVMREALKDLGRTELTEEELHSFTWNFRFKEMAGEAWTSEDPWWNDQPPVKVWFRPGGAVERDPGFAGIHIEWRWGNSSTREPGSGSPPAACVKCTVGGRDVPSYLCGRHPVHGGFFMHSCWALYTAFPMPPKHEDERLRDEALNLFADAQMDEVREYNLINSDIRLRQMRFGQRSFEVSEELAAILEGLPREDQIGIIRTFLRRQAGDWEGDMDDGMDLDDGMESSSDAGGAGTDEN